MAGDDLDERKSSSLDDLSDIDSINDDSDDDGDGTGDKMPQEPVEWLATSRSKRSTAGNRMKSMLANEEPAADDSDLELLFAEDEDDAGFSDQAADDASDVHMDSSSDEEDKQDNADEMEGEKELERQAREKRTADRKRKAQEAIPAKFRKKVRIEQPAARPPRPKKKSERTSWLPSPADMPTRASERRTTKLSKEQLHQKMVSDEIRRKKLVERMEKKAKQLEALKKPPKTQAERLAEAAIIEKRNSKSLNRWEEAEKQREEERLRKIAALNNRKLDGPVVTFWSGILELQEGQDKHVGNLVSMEERPKKKRQSAAAALAAKEAEAATPTTPVDNLEGKLGKPDDKAGENTPPAGPETPTVKTEQPDTPNLPNPPVTPSQPSAETAETLTTATAPTAPEPAAPGPTTVQTPASAPAPVPIPGAVSAQEPVSTPATAPVSASVSTPQPVSTPQLVSTSAPTSTPAPVPTPAHVSTPASVTTPQPVSTPTPVSISEPVFVLNPESAPISTPTPASNSAPNPASISAPAPVSTSASTSTSTATPTAMPPPPPPLPETRPSSSAVLAAPILAPPAGISHSSGGQMPMLGFPAGPKPFLAAPNTSHRPSPLANPPSTPTAPIPQQIGALPISTPKPKVTIPQTPLPFTPATPLQTPQTASQLASARPPTETPQEPPTATTSDPPREGKVTKSCIILQNFNDHAIRDKQVQNQILFGRKMNKLAKPAHPPLCVITNHPAKYRDPKTGLPYYNAYAYREIQRVYRGDYKWSRLVGAWVGRGDYAAQGVPEWFLHPEKARPVPRKGGENTMENGDGEKEDGEKEDGEKEDGEKEENGNGNAGKDGDGEKGEVEGDGGKQGDKAPEEPRLAVVERGEEAAPEGSEPLAASSAETPQVTAGNA